MNCTMPEEINLDELKNHDISKLNNKECRDLLDRLRTYLLDLYDNNQKMIEEGKKIIEGQLLTGAGSAKIRTAEEVPDSELRKTLQSYMTATWQASFYLVQNMTGPTSLDMVHKKTATWPAEFHAIVQSIERNAVAMTSLYSQLEQKTKEFDANVQDLERIQKNYAVAQEQYKTERAAGIKAVGQERVKAFEANVSKTNLEQKLKGEYSQLEKTHQEALTKLEKAEADIQKADDAYHAKLREIQQVRTALKEQSELAERARVELADSTQLYEAELRKKREQIAQGATAFNETLSRAEVAEQQLKEQMDQYRELHDEYQKLDQQKKTIDGHLTDAVAKIEKLERELLETQGKVTSTTTQYTSQVTLYSQAKQRADNEKIRADKAEKKLRRKRIASFVVGTAAAGLIGLLAYVSKPQADVEKVVEVPGPERIVEKILYKEEPKMVIWGLGFGHGKGVFIEEAIQEQVYNQLFELQKEAGRDYTEEDLRKLVSFIDTNKPFGKIFRDEFDSAKFSEFNKRLGYKK